eukprot:2425415-Pleurochrysis_carterae.AAC.7
MKFEEYADGLGATSIARVTKHGPTGYVLRSEPALDSLGRTLAAPRKLRGHVHPQDCAHGAARRHLGDSLVATES